MSGLLLNTELTPEQRDFAETTRSSGDALLTIINDILDFSKIEAGKLALEEQPFDLPECLESSLDLLKMRAVEKGLELACVVDPAVPHAIRGDVTRLRQVLINLLSNAIKFTERGEVVLSVSLADARAQAATRFVGPRAALHLTVRDTGVGIPRDRHDRLFQSFTQVDASTTRRHGGTGLGLAISRRLVELMGGTMWVESEAGQGSTFHFTIAATPAPDLKPRAHRDTAPPQLRGKRVLIVDDNATNRRVLSLQARGWGMDPLESASPLEALERIRSGEAFDLAFLDLRMPEMDGMTLAAEIRKHRDADALPLVLVSSTGAHTAAPAPFAASLSKPIKQSALFDVLSGIFAAWPPAPAAAPAPAPALDPLMGVRQPLRVLLAEDNAVNQKVALRLLQQLGYRADVAANGLEAIDAVARQPYDVLLMDVQMPEMDGLEATRLICARWPRERRPWVVAMTADAMQGDREKCLEAGMDDYVSKPIRVDELIAALARVAAREDA
jgi:CheY-like chemotaxis protein